MGLDTQQPASVCFVTEAVFLHLLPSSVIIFLLLKMDLDLESVSGLEDPIRETGGLLVGRRSRYSQKTKRTEQ